MKIKHFSLRLQSEHLTQDEAKLNQFLETVEVHRPIGEDIIRVLDGLR